VGLGGDYNETPIENLYVFWSFALTVSFACISLSWISFRRLCSDRYRQLFCTAQNILTGLKAVNFKACKISSAKYVPVLQIFIRYVLSTAVYYAHVLDNTCRADMRIADW